MGSCWLEPGEDGGDSCIIVGLDLVEYEEAGVLKTQCHLWLGLRIPAELSFLGFSMCGNCQGGVGPVGGKGTRARIPVYIAIRMLVPPVTKIFGVWRGSQVIEYSAMRAVRVAAEKTGSWTVRSSRKIRHRGLSKQLAEEKLRWGSGAHTIQKRG